MRPIRPLLVSLLCAGSVLAGSQAETDLDRNTAFYEGESLNYVIYPPDRYQMVDWEATADGYSFAFIPPEQTYDSADMLIGVNIFKIRGLSFADVVKRDTAAVRKHYGKSISIWPVDSVYAASGQSVATFFVNDTTRFIPNVMLAYVDGQTELLVFELVITERVATITAEDVFIECLEKLKVLPVGQLGYE